jgi:hypothetical protein
VEEKVFIFVVLSDGLTYNNMQSICFGLKVGWIGGCLGEGSIIPLLNPFIFPYLPYIVEVLRSHTNHSLFLSWLLLLLWFYRLLKKVNCNGYSLQILQ